jgi:hypothetical protein
MSSSLLPARDSLGERLRGQPAYDPSQTSGLSERSKAYEPLRAYRRRKRLSYSQTQALRDQPPHEAEAPTAATHEQSETSLDARRLLRAYEQQRDLPWPRQLLLHERKRDQPRHEAPAAVRAPARPAPRRRLSDKRETQWASPPYGQGCSVLRRAERGTSATKEPQ